MYRRPGSRKRGAMSWNILRIQPRHEQVAASRLASLGLVTFLPMTTATIRRGRSRARCQVQRPIFLGYVFVVGNDRLWTALHQVSAINGFLRRADGGPAVLSDQAIAAVREAAAMANATPANRWPFQPGDRVRVRDRADPFFGIVGILERLDRKDRAVIELMTNYRVKVTVAASRLEAAD
jgi:transcription antitermination factor NusG